MPEPEDFEFRLLRQLWRRKAVILCTIIAVTLLATFVVLQVTPRYTASAELMIEPRRFQAADIEAVMSGLPLDLETIQSEVQVLRSRGLAHRVVDAMKLHDEPEFNPRLARRTGWGASFGIPDIVPPEWLARLLGFFRRVDPTAGPDAAGRERVEVVEEFLDRLDAVPRGRSRVIEISFESEDPRTAAAVANKLAELYLAQQVEAKHEATRLATGWLEGQLSGLRQNVAASEQAVEAYRRNAGLVEGKGATLAAQQFSELNTQFVLARSKLAEAEARFARAKALMRSGGVGSAADVLASPLIQRLRGQEADVERKVAELSAEYGERHPQMINMRAEARELFNKIEVEVNRIFEKLRNEVAVARARERSLEKSVGELEAEVARLNEKQVRLRALEREADASRALFETLLTRFKETDAQRDLQQTDARLISVADVPVEPSYPRTTLIIAMAAIGSSLLGVLLAFVLEQFDRGFRSLQQLERLTGRPALGLVPSVGRFRRPAHRFVVDSPDSAFSGAIQMLHANILLSDAAARPKVVLVTSALPREGKTTTALSLCRTAARAGFRTVFVEADLRRPTLSERTGVPSKPGLAEFLAGEAPLATALYEDTASGAVLLPAGDITVLGGGPLDPAQMSPLLQALSQHHDLVVLDSPPTLAVADARILARLADKIAFVVRWGSTRREVAAMALRQVDEVGGDLAGLVLSRVNLRKHARYGDADSSYYHRLSKTYYAG